MTILAFLLLAAALTAALAAAVQQGRELRQMRDDVDLLKNRRQVNESTSEHAARAPQMFSGLYAEDQSSAVADLATLPGVRVVGTGVLLGLVGTAIMLVAFARGRSANSARLAEAVAAREAAVDSVALLRTSRDSLQSLVQALQDSTRRLTASQAAGGSRPRRSTRPVTRTAAVAPAPALPPAPKLP